MSNTFCTAASILWMAAALFVGGQTVLAQSFYLNNTTHPQSGTPNFVVGDSFTITISGASPNSPVYLTATQNGATVCTNFRLGYTNSSGYYSASGTQASSTVETWTESYSVNATQVANVRFFILATLPTVSLLNSSDPALDSPSGASFAVGDAYPAQVTSGSPAAYQLVTLTSTQNGTAYGSLGVGTTDSGGNFTLSGTQGASEMGSWTEQWYVGGPPATPSLAFQVIQAPSDYAPGSGPASIAGSFTAPDPVIQCDLISGSWNDEDSYGDSQGWIPSLKAGPVARPSPQVSTANSTWTSLTPRYLVAHSSYIPVDNIHGPTLCGYLNPGETEVVNLFKLYKGDAFRGTARTMEWELVIPDMHANDPPGSNAGPTRNYGYGSPVNGSTLSSTPLGDPYTGRYSGADEDNIANDCYLWNASGKADTSTMLGHAETWTSPTSMALNLYGSGNDPLEYSLGGIKWNTTVSISDTGGSATASVATTHTCYPAHIVKVNGTPIYSYQPSPGHNNTYYLVGCLLDAIPETVATVPATPVPSN